MMLLASAAKGVPENPNWITLLGDLAPDSPLVHVLEQAENLIFSLLFGALICLAFHWGLKNRRLIPDGFQNFLEWSTELLDRLIVEISGKPGTPYFPFLASLFVYILAMNLIGMFPLMKSPSSNLNTTLALAICVFCLVQYLNIRNMGFFGFLYHLAGSPKNTLEWLLSPLILPIEILTQLSRPLTLSVRLFGNVLGEKILIGVFTLMGISLSALLHFPIGFPIQLPFIMLSLLTGLMQALIFTILTTIYIVLSTPECKGEPH